MSLQTNLYFNYVLWIDKQSKINLTKYMKKKNRLGHWCGWQVLLLNVWQAEKLVLIKLALFHC